MNQLLHWLIDLLYLVYVLHGSELNSSVYCEVGPCYSFNLACDNTGKVKKCFKRATLLREHEYRSIMDDVLNELRHNVAGGEIYRNLPVAARMGKLYWNKELAYFARLDVSRCAVVPRPCMSSKNFYQIGHLAGLANFVNSNSTTYMINAIKSIAQDWSKDISRITRLDTLRLKVGEKERDDIFNYVILSCAFNRAIQEDERIYEWGGKPGVKCRRKDMEYTNLCNSDEKYVYHKPKLHLARMWQE
ncbi:allergen Tab y 5.0101 isoform X1 [Drosophila albomicans]|uniref:Allergen Tab y 5.0101 isoform X1 n=1 Tax=Drosophila albomicans TaxID=7291 RepID=A0A9C6T3Q9_DROAB|nr:allergen Tab y 5.0101 isoform X1 [Drosophila albomicans]